jgi:hypothetical protein
MLLPTAREAEACLLLLFFLKSHHFNKKALKSWISCSVFLLAPQFEQNVAVCSISPPQYWFCYSYALSLCSIFRIRMVADGLSNANIVLSLPLRSR